VRSRKYTINQGAKAIEIEDIDARISELDRAEELGELRSDGVKP